jgi:hypothetical protein
MASIERVRGGYRVRWRDGGRAASLKSSPIITTKPKAVAERDRIAATVAARRPVRSGAILPMTELIERWRQSRDAIGNDPLWTSVVAKRITSLCADRAWTHPTDITPATVQTWRLDGGSPRGGACLRAVLRWAFETLEQPVDLRTLIALRPPRAKRRADRPLLSESAIERWQRDADALSPNCGALVHCLITYGWRPITAARLTIADIDLAGATVTCRIKGGDQLVHPIFPDTVDRLRPLCAGRAGTAALFISPYTGAAWPPRSSQSIPGRLRKIYDLKRVAISRMLRGDAPWHRPLAPQEVAHFTGHKTIGQVLRYARTSLDRARDLISGDNSVVHHGSPSALPRNHRHPAPNENTGKTA